VPSAADEDEDASAIPDAFSFDDDMPNTPVPAYSQVQYFPIQTLFESHTHMPVDTSGASDHSLSLM
jgi:hypothetical protein